MQNKHFVDVLIVTAIIAAVGFALYTVCYKWKEEQDKLKADKQKPKPLPPITGFGQLPA